MMGIRKLILILIWWKKADDVFTEASGGHQEFRRKKLL